MSENSDRIKKFQLCGIVSTVIGIALAATAIFIPQIMQNAIQNSAKEGAQLSAKNQANWDTIPGQSGLGIYWNHFMYNCTNVWDVVFQNAMPSFMEFGPYVYQESDTYTDLTWTTRVNNLTEIVEDVVLATFN